MAWEERLDRIMTVHLPDLQVLCEEPMCRHTSFRIGGPAKRMAFPDSGEELERLIQLARECGARPFVMGNGTNLLAPDEGLDRLVIRTPENLCRIGLEVNETDAIRAEAGASLRRVAEFACEHGLRGLEFAHGIPGSLGGAVCMNAGAYGGEMAQVIRTAAVLFPGEGVRVLSPEALQLGYRHSLLTERPEAVVLYVVLALEAGERETIRTRMRDLMARRRRTQPLEYASAGSTFKRPAGHFAGTLIEQCGLKGLRVGGAQVSEKHAGFVINLGGATCADVKTLMAEIQRRVLDQTGVSLEPEVRVIES